jgi:outer membrane lipoprotein-sorting protein
MILLPVWSKNFGTWLALRLPKGSTRSPAAAKKAASPLLISILLVACTTVPVKKTADRDELAQVIENTQKRQAISGTVFLTSRLSGQRAVTAPAVVLAQWPDKLRLEIQDPLGSTLALLVLNGDRFWFYRSESAEILTGPLARMSKEIGFLNSAETFLQALLARPVLTGTSGRTFLEHGIEDHLGKAKRTVIWSGRTFQPETVTEESADGTTSKLELADYEVRAGLVFPEKVQLTRTLPKQNPESVTFEWRDWQPFVPEEKKLFQIPQQQTFGRKIKALR